MHSLKKKKEDYSFKSGWMHTFVFPSAQLTELHFQNVKDKYPSNGSIKTVITIVTVCRLPIPFFFLFFSFWCLFFATRLLREVKKSSPYLINDLNVGVDSLHMLSYEILFGNLKISLWIWNLNRPLGKYTTTCCTHQYREAVIYCLLLLFPKKLFALEEGRVRSHPALDILRCYA